MGNWYSEVYLIYFTFWLMQAEDVANLWISKYHLYRSRFKKTTFCGTMHMDMNWTSFEPIFHSHNKIKAESANWQDFQTIDYSLFLEISKNSMTPPQNVESTLAHPKCLISGFKLRYLILKHFSDTLCHKFFYFDVTHKFVNLHQLQYWGLRKIWLKISIISDFHPGWNGTFFLQNFVFWKFWHPKTLFFWSKTMFLSQNRKKALLISLMYSTWFLLF